MSKERDLEILKSEEYCAALEKEIKLWTSLYELKPIAESLENIFVRSFRRINEPVIWECGSHQSGKDIDMTSLPISVKTGFISPDEKITINSFRTTKYPTLQEKIEYHDGPGHTYDIILMCIQESPLITYKKSELIKMAIKYNIDINKCTKAMLIEKILKFKTTTTYKIGYILADEYKAVDLNWVENIGKIGKNTGKLQGWTGINKHGDISVTINKKMSDQFWITYYKKYFNLITEIIINNDEIGTYFP